MKIGMKRGLYVRMKQTIETSVGSTSLGHRIPKAAGECMGIAPELHTGTMKHRAII